MGILGAAVICEALIGYSNADWALPKSVVFTGSLLALVVLSTWRILYGGALIAAMGSHKILFLGSSPLAFKIARQFQDRPEFGMKAIGYLADKPAETDLQMAGGPGRRCIHCQAPETEYGRHCHERRSRPIAYARFAGCSLNRRAYRRGSVLYEQTFGRVCIDEILPYELIFSTELGPRRWTLRAQMIYSTLIALIAAIVALPVVLIAALLIKATSSGPAFYRQKRVGQNGESFFIYKLRSMYQNAEAGTGAVWATQNDSRITPLGRFLRKSRLDELPQLLNVLRGEMTIVGPRPERPEFVRELNQTIPYYRQRHCVKPGLRVGPKSTIAMAIRFRIRRSNWSTICTTSRMPHLPLTRT